MNQYVSQGVFDRRVKLIEEKLKHIDGGVDKALLDKLEKENQYYVDQIVDNINSGIISFDSINQQIADALDAAEGYTDIASQTATQNNNAITAIVNEFINGYNNFAANTLRFNDVFDSDGEFTGKIRPTSIETAALFVGTRSQQLALNGIEFRVLPYEESINDKGVLQIISSEHSKNGAITQNARAGFMFHYGFGTDTAPKVYVVNEAELDIKTDLQKVSNHTLVYIGNDEYEANNGVYIYAKLTSKNEDYKKVENIDNNIFNEKYLFLYTKDGNNYSRVAGSNYNSIATYYVKNPAYVEDNTKSLAEYLEYTINDEESFIESVGKIYTRSGNNYNLVTKTSYSSVTDYYERNEESEVKNTATTESDATTGAGGQYANDFIADIFISQEQIKLKDVTNYLVIKLGYISIATNASKSNSKQRKVDMTYGSTTIDGRLITTGKIEGNGVSMDLDTGEIIGNLKFESGGESVQEIFERFQSELNGEIESWFKAYAPVDLSSQSPKEPLIWIDDTVIPPIPCLPYKDWYDTDNGGTGQEVATERIKHIGDLFYDTTTGKSFRFIDSGTENNHHFEWIQIVDSDIATALAQANSAMAKANAITYGTTSIAGGMITSNLMLLKKFGFINCDINSVFDSEKSYFTITNTGTSSEYHEVALNLDENTFNANKTSYYYINSTNSIVNSGVSGIEDFPAFWANGTESKAAAVRYWSNHYNTSPNTYTSAYEALKANASSLPTVFIDFNGTSRFGDMWIVGDAVKWTPSVNELKLYNNDDRTDWVTLRYNNGALQVVRQDGGDVYIQCTNSSTYSSSIQYYTKNGSTYTAASPNESIFNSNKTHYFYKDSTATAGVYSDWISALGANSSGGGGGGGINWADFWNELNLSETHSYSGTKIIDRNYLPINGTSSYNGTFYAPTSSGTSGQFLVSNGSGAPSWTTITRVTGVKGSSESTYRTGNVNITKSNIGLGNVTNDAQLPIAGGTMTGILKIKDGLGIESESGNGLLAYKPTTWSYVTNTQWGLGSNDCQGVIRSNNSNLLHSKNGTSYAILDTSNYNSYSPTLTGTGASGTWGISITGNAATATTASKLGTSNVGSLTNPIYLSSGTATACTYSLSSTVNGGTANRLAYYTSSGIDDASTIYASNTKLAINSTTEPSQNLYVNGSTGHADGHIYLTGANASSSTVNTTQLVFGTSSNNHVALSSNNNALIINPSTISTTGQVFLGVNGNSSYFSSSGNFGIGTDSPAYKLDIKGDAYNIIRLCRNHATNGASIRFENNSGCLGYFGYDGDGYYAWTDSGGNNKMIFKPDGTLGVNTTSPSSQCKLHVNGNIYATGGVTALQTVSSDKRLKKNIKKFKAKDIIDKLNPVSFEWNSKAKKLSDFKDGTNYGLIAQDSDNIIDDFVFDLPDGKGYKGVRYEKLIPILLQAIKEQQKEIDELKSIVKQLKNK